MTSLPHIKNWRDILIKNSAIILPFILNIILSLTLLWAYDVSAFSIWTVIAVIISYISFRLGDFVRKLTVEKKTIRSITGRLIIVVFILFSLLLSILLIKSDYGIASFYDWFTSGSNAVDTQPRFVLALLVTFTVFFSLVIYYFTQCMYRLSFTMLISLLPCVICIQVRADISNIYVTLISILNIALLIINRRAVIKDNMHTVSHRSSIISSCTFILILLIVSAAIPKENEARFADTLERFLLKGNTNFTLPDNYSALSKFSGNADFFRFHNVKRRRMYTLYGTDAVYLKRQVFDYYDFEKDLWYGDKELEKPTFDIDYWSTIHSCLSISSLHSAIKAADVRVPEFTDKYNLRQIVDAPLINDLQKTLYIRPENFSASYYLSTARILKPTVKNSSIAKFTHSGTVSTAIPHDSNETYRITFFDETIPQELWLKYGGANMSIEQSEQMLTELSTILSKQDGSPFTSIQMYLKELDYAKLYNERCSENNALISPEIQQLAEDITKSCEYDFQKAAAIRDYFTNNGFTYDLEYVSPDTSPEYFLFNSKRGTCSDYASAFTLMARSVGLTVRYAEGYVPEPAAYENTYTIDNLDSHAYPEVFIPNMGWVVFEPTVSAMYSEDNDNTAAFSMSWLNFDYRLTASIIAVAAVLVLLFMLFVIAAPIIGEVIFSIRISRTSPNTAAVMIYNRILQQFCVLTKRDDFTPTMYELAQAVDSEIGCDIYRLAFEVERVLYTSAYTVSEEQRSEFIQLYKDIRNSFKTYKKHQKSKRGE